YTSGSTGQPKGVTVSHRNVVHSTWARQHYYRDTVGRYLLLSSFAFDSSVAGLFWTLSQGGCLVLPEDAHVKDPVQLGALIRDRQVTHLLALPALYEAVLEHAAPSALVSLKTAIVAGEACADKVAEHHFERLPNTRLFNEYGPTEATVWSTAAAVLPGRPITIGKPIANVRAYIVDRTLQPVPVGVVGELLIGGAGITRGYLGRPEASAEKFVPDPFGAAGERLYKTGDLARYRSDGDIEFVGRIDHQVKLRGYRIELGEIEACLTACPGIAAAAVTLREDSPGNPRLVAYIVAEASGAPDADAVKARLKRSLPEYMVPTAYATLDALPLNANGKADRSKLPAPDLEARRDDAYQAPRDEAEAAVADVWREILGVERISIHDDFFDLGGHSLAGVQVTAKIQELFGIDVPVNVLFEAPTVAQFVDRVAAYQEA
ncbi:MAG: non-ribosomal peptide synthetase, partial [Gammaproteobacteria bacterium]